MSCEFIVFWVLGVVITQLAWTTVLPYALALVWVGILFIIVLMFNLDLDLLASILAGVYSSVFLFLSLLSVHLTPYWSSATKTQPQSWAKNISLLVIVMLISAAAIKPATSTYTSFLWQDLYGTAGEAFNLSVGVLHWLFYRLFSTDVIFLNLYLLVGLGSAAALLVLFRSWSTPNHVRGLKALARTSAQSMTTSSARIRMVAQFRRQVRRKNSSSVRSRL